MEVELKRAHVEVGVYDGDEEHYILTNYPVICCTLGSEGKIIFPLGAKVVLTVEINKINYTTLAKSRRTVTL